MSNKYLKKPVKIMVFGTFDGVHKGHIDFFKQAKNLSRHSFLIVSIARDCNVKKIKGIPPVFDEKKRQKMVESMKIPDKVVLGGIRKHFPHILREAPDIIALGYDQKQYVKNLKKDLAALGLVVRLVRLKPYQEKVYKSSLLNRAKRL